MESRLIRQGAKGWQFRRGPFARRALPPLRAPGWTLLVQGVDLHDDGRRSWQEVVDAISPAICIVDRGGRIRRANRAFADLVNAPPASLIGRPWQAFVPPEWGTDIQRALDQQGAGREVELRTGERTYAVTAVPISSTDRSAVVLLFDVAPASGTLDQWVRDGGGLIIAAGPRLGGRTASLLAGTVQGMAERLDDRGGSFGDVSLEHPVFAPFRAAGSEDGGLGGARFLRYPRLAPLEGSQVVARFDDGNPALVERAHGSGRVLVVTAPLDNLTGDWDPTQYTDEYREALLKKSRLGRWMPATAS